MTIEKYKNDYGSFDITIIDSNKVLSVFLGGADPNISCQYNDYKRIDEITFVIPNTEEDLFNIFNKLYKNIVSGNVLDYSPDSSEAQQLMKNETSYSWYQEVVRDGIITILSDAYPVNCPNILKISKEKNSITLSFMQINNPEVRLPKNPFCITINIRQEGSKIHDFCFPFKTLFQELQSLTETKDKKILKKA